jgi:mono/diheme cytochrome c family protein
MNRKMFGRGIAGSALWVAPAVLLVFGGACKSSVSGDETNANPSSSDLDSPQADAGMAATPWVNDPGVGGGSAPAPAADAGTGPGLAQDPAPSDDTRCAELAAEVEWILTDYCSGCHANGNTQGGFGAVLDVPKLVSSGKIVPNDPDASKIYTFVKTGIMPKSTNKPQAAEIESLGEWIACGAPDFRAPGPTAGLPPFMSIDKRLGAISDDLRSFENPTDRARMRYIDFSHLSNAGSLESDVDNYRKAVSLLLNSLSFGRFVVPPEPIDKDNLLYRIDLRDYAWDAATWELVVEEYPYMVRYDENSRLFPYDEDTALDIRQETGTEIPYIQADWLIAHASRPPLYYDVLEVPTDINQLALDQGVDVQQDIDDAQVARAGFNRSGVSLNNRVIERHEQPGSGGAFWLSYDFAGSVDQQNIFAHPVDFQQNGGEGFFNLPNGLQAYFILNANFDRLDEAPTNIVTDPDNRTGAVEAGLSCMGGCHLSKGVLVKDDKIRSYVLTTGASADVIEASLELYPEVDDMHALMDWDIDRYSGALADTGFDLADGKSIIRMVRKHDDVLYIEDVAGSLGVPVSRLLSSLNASPAAFPGEIVALRDPQGSIYREVFDTLFDDIVLAMGLGEQILADGVDTSAVDSSAGVDSSSGRDSGGTPEAGYQQPSEAAGAGSSGDSASDGSASDSGSGSRYRRRD